MKFKFYNVTNGHWEYPNGQGSGVFVDEFFCEVEADGLDEAFKLAEKIAKEKNVNKAMLAWRKE